MARPMPRLAPVMMATRSLSDDMVALLRDCLWPSSACVPLATSCRARYPDCWLVNRGNPEAAMAQLKVRITEQEWLAAEDITSLDLWRSAPNHFRKWQLFGCA